MNRLQNILLVAWGLLVLVFVVFNWGLIWREEPIVLLFMEFQLPWLFWFAVGSLALPAIFRGFAWSATHRADRRAQQEVAAIKAQAFDNRDRELETLAQRIQEKLEPGLRALGAPSAPEESEGGAPKGKKD